jgi:UDP-GlcNAc:undecaprenyl-phosphate/decaprenyl-phosphate GlcNAc-1-phosphate transferase
MALTVAFVVAVVAALLAARLARRLGLVDRPGPRKVQSEPVPYLGGLAVFAGLAGPVVIARPVLLVPLSLSLALGLADDIADPPPRLRLGIETGIGVITAFVLPAGDLAGGLFTVAVVVGLLNAVNLLDGLDGLAAAVCTMSTLGFALVLEGDFQVLALALAGSLVGFLVWNRPPARIYLGDAGSYLIGNVLAILLAASFTQGQSVGVASGALLFLAVPVADIVVAIVRRHRAGRPLFYGDRGHMYDQLVDRGWGSVVTVAACTGAQAVLVAVGLAIGNLPVGVAVGITAPVIVIIGTAALVAFTTPGTWKAG